VPAGTALSLSVPAAKAEAEAVGTGLDHAAIAAAGHFVRPHLDQFELAVSDVDRLPARNFQRFATA